MGLQSDGTWDCNGLKHTCFNHLKLEGQVSTISSSALQKAGSERKSSVWKPFPRFNYKTLSAGIGDNAHTYVHTGRLWPGERERGRKKVRDPARQDGRKIGGILGGK